VKREKLKFGIPLFDYILEGGLPLSSFTVVYGYPYHGFFYLPKMLIKSALSKEERKVFLVSSISPSHLSLSSILQSRGSEGNFHFLHSSPLSSLSKDIEFIEFHVKKESLILIVIPKSIYYVSLVLKRKSTSFIDFSHMNRIFAFLKYFALKYDTYSVFMMYIDPLLDEADIPLSILPVMWADNVIKLEKSPGGKIYIKAMKGCRRMGLSLSLGVSTNE